MSHHCHPVINLLLQMILNYLRAYHSQYFLQVDYLLLSLINYLPDNLSHHLNQKQVSHYCHLVIQILLPMILNYLRAYHLLYLLQADYLLLFPLNYLPDNLLHQLSRMQGSHHYHPAINLFRQMILNYLQAYYLLYFLLIYHLLYFPQADYLLLSLINYL